MEISEEERTAIEKLEQRNRELSILRAIAEELNRAVEIKSALEIALKMVAELFGLKSGWVWLLDEETSEPFLAASRNLPPFLTAKPSRMRGSNCLCLRTFRAGDISGAANVNVLECSRLEGEVDGTDGLRYHASIPIYAHDKRLGVMNLASSDWRGLEENDLQLLYIIGYQLGTMVERARLFERAARLAAAEERNRLAREIHDTIAQGLAAITLNLESSEAFLDNVDEVSQAKGRQKLNKALNLTRANLDELRRWVLDLRGGPFLEKPLAEAIAELVYNFGAEVELETHFELKTAEIGRRYPSRVELALFRIVQEGLSNIRKHSEAKIVQVTLELETKNKNKQQLRLTVQDDGKGFDTNRLPQPQELTSSEISNWGLIGINERVHFLNGQLTIESYPGNGTRIEVTVPLH